MSAGHTFLFYPNDFLGSSKVGMMGGTEIGVYVMLLLLDWQDNGFVFDPPRLAHWCHVDEPTFNQAWTAVERCFKHRSGRMYNEKLDIERKRQEEWRKKSREGGVRSGQVRATKGGSKMVGPQNEPKGNQKGTLPLSLPLSLAPPRTSKSGAASPINLLPNKQQEPTDADAGLPEQPEPPVPDPIGYLMPLIRQHLYCDTRPPLVSENGKMVRYSEGRDVLILRALLKHRSPEELASAIQGIARLRDSGQLKTLGPQFYPRKPMTMRVLYNTKVLVRGDADLRWAMDAAIRETLETL